MNDNLIGYKTSRVNMIKKISTLRGVIYSDYSNTSINICFHKFDSNS